MEHTTVEWPGVLVRSLPTQTQASFYLILLVFLGTLLAALVGPSPICMAPVVLSLLVLPARALLAKPRQELALEDRAETERLRASGDFQKVQRAIEHLAGDIGYHEPIRLLVSKNPREARAAGSWRHHYILLGREVVEKVACDLDHAKQTEKAHALLMHEIAHLYHRDVQRIGYTRELLRYSAILLPWWMLFLAGWLGFALTMGEAFLAFDLATVEGVDPTVVELLGPMFELSPDGRAEVTSDVENISIGLMLSFLFNALLPIAFISLILWLFFWRRLLRMQEYYADGLVRDHGISWNGMSKAMGRYPSWVRPAPPKLTGVWQSLRQLPASTMRFLSLHQSQSAAFSSLSQRLAPKRVPRWFATHPTYRERIAHFKDVSVILTDWRSVAWATAVLILALDVMLVTPLVSYHTIGYPIHISTVAIFLLVSTWILPLMVLRLPYRSNLLKIIAIVFGVRWVWLLFNILLLLALVLLAPAYAREMLNILVISGSRVAVMPELLPVLEEPLAFTLSVLPRVAGLQLLQVSGVALLLGFYWWVQRASLLSGRQVNWAQRHWWTVFALSVLVLALFLTPLSDLLSGTAQQLRHPVRLASYGAALLVGIVVWLFLSRQEGTQHA